jgi:hypothetical protein
MDRGRAQSDLSKWGATHLIGARRLTTAPYRRMQVALCPIMMARMPQPDSLLISYLRESYRTGRLTPAAVMEALLGQSPEADAHHVWISPSAP